MKDLTQQCIMREGMIYSLAQPVPIWGYLKKDCTMNFDRRFNMKKVLSLEVVSLFLGLSLAGCMTPLEQAIEKNKQALEKIRKSHGK